MSKSYDKALEKFKESFTDFLSRIEKKINNLNIKVESFDSNILTLKNNTVHTYSGNSGIKTLTINYPDGDFISTIIFSTSKSGNINIVWPANTLFIGSEEPKFFPAENWEVNIHNGRVACAQIYGND